jgi:hypothetical protein
MGSARRYLVTDFLFARPSWLSGMARVFDIWGFFDFYNSSTTPKVADIRATLSDWYIVGQDLAGAIDEFDSEQDESHTRQGQLFPSVAHPV